MRYGLERRVFEAGRIRVRVESRGGSVCCWMDVWVERKRSIENDYNDLGLRWG